MNTPKSVEVDFTGSLDGDFVELVDLDIMSGQSAVVLKIKAPCTLLISTSEWAQVYFKKAEEQTK